MSEQLLGLLGVLAAIGLLAVALALLGNAIERAQARRIACQIRLTDACFSIGVMASPVVRKRAGGRWAVALRIPEACVDVDRLLVTLYDRLCALGIGSDDVRLVLTRHVPCSNDHGPDSASAVAVEHRRRVTGRIRDWDALRRPGR